MENPENTPKPKPTVDPYLMKTVLTKNNATRKVTFADGCECLYKQTLPVINGKTIDVDDMAEVNDINEVDLLFNLHNRLKLKKTFTNVGPTLLIVNPFVYIDGVYGENQIERYLRKQEQEHPDRRTHVSEPHLYDLVLIAIKQLLKPNSNNQALVISGESGAGKTEATKNAMKCITYYFSKNGTKCSSSSSSNDVPLETQILNCNPILESFGNAKTVRNDNSSRFGKYVKIKLNSITNVIEGAEMSTYLLEKSRISELNEKERNYHIFYALLNCGDDLLLSSLYLNKDIKSYKYLYTSERQVTEVNTINDKQWFIELTECFKSTGFNDDDITTIFKVVAAVLLLGNVRIKIVSDKSIVDNIGIFNNICDLLSLDNQLLLTVLTRKPPMPGRKEYGGTYTETQVKSYIDALAKELYNRLFLWIVLKLNTKLNQSNNNNDNTRSSSKYIGLLDIFGFECFDKNSLEQLCINYTNEQLQQLYIKDIFENDKDEFRREGLEDKIHLLDATYKDNKDVIRLIKVFFNRLRDVKDDKHIYTLVSNFQKEIDKPPKGDTTFRKVKHNKFKTNRLMQDTFTIEHTAKDVVYSVTNFVDKNKDETKPGVVDCILQSKNMLIQMIFTNTITEQQCNNAKVQLMQERLSVDNNKIKNRYLGMKFCNEMKSLKNELKQCDHHYIRCLKPNEDKKALLFHPTFTFNQIQYLGILATIQVRKSGFPMRSYYKDFYENYKMVLAKARTNEDGKYVDVVKEVIKELIGEEEMKGSENECLYGVNKIYMKQSFNARLENVKVQKMNMKYKSIRILFVAVDYLHKRQRVLQYKTSIGHLQKFFNTNKKQIHLQKTKAKIKTIQSLYHTYNAYITFASNIQLHITIQNSIRSYITQKQIYIKRMKHQFITYQLQLHLIKLKAMHRALARCIANKIISNAKAKIMYVEYNKMWNKLQPFFISYLCRKKYKHVIKDARIMARREGVERAMCLFQNKLLFNNVCNVNKACKFIYNYGIVSIHANYYLQMRKHVYIIQRYVKRYYNKQNVFYKLNNINEECSSQNIQLLRNKMLSIIFPNYYYYCTNISNTTTTTIEHNDKSSLNTIEVSNRNEYKKYPSSIMTSENDYDDDNNTARNYATISHDIIIKERKRYINSGYINSISGMSKRSIPKYTKPPSLIETILPKLIHHKEPQITFFAKILDIDIINDDTEINDKTWYEQYIKVYRDAMYNQSPIQFINVTNTHTMCVSSKGKVYAWGWNNNGQCFTNPLQSVNNFILPHNIKSLSLTLPVINYQHSVEVPLNDFIIKTAVNDDYTLLLNDKGSVITFDYGVPHEMKVFKGNVKDVKVSDININVVVTKDNEMYMWDNTQQQQQQPNIKNVVKKVVFDDKKVQVDSVQIGNNIIVILTTNGKCYVIDKPNININTNANYITSHELPLEPSLSVRIIQVRCGYKHVICATAIGTAFGWGNNSYGQLGQRNKNIKGITPIIINNNTHNTKHKIIQIAAGYRSSFYMTDKRDIYYSGFVSETKHTHGIEKFNINEKTIDIANESEYGIVRIMCTFSRYISIFYATVADIRGLYDKVGNQIKVNEILNTLSEKWTNDEISAPFIPHISRFFSAQCMKVGGSTKHKNTKIHK